LPGLYSAFSAASLHGKTRLHRNELPPPPRTWKDLQNHVYRGDFLSAASVEYKALQDMNTFESIPRPSSPSVRVLPLLWVFTYKFDPDGYLLKFKARVCVEEICNLSIVTITTLPPLLLRRFALSWLSVPRLILKYCTLMLSMPLSMPQLKETFLWSTQTDIVSLAVFFVCYVLSMAYASLPVFGYKSYHLRLLLLG
jgi:hypothetical protein